MIIVVVGGAASEGLLRLMRLEGVEVKVELRRTREGQELVTGERIARQEEWVDLGFFQAVRAMDRAKQREEGIR